jgi:glutamyl-tRNA(Gln) amidotransferase subunit D
LETGEKGILLLKLKTGYNIGIPKENLLGGEVLKKFVSGKVKKNEEKVGMGDVGGEGKKKIGLVITGGTIASKLDPRTGGVKHLVEIDEFRKFYPKLFEIVSVVKIDSPFMISSEAMSWEEWGKIASSVQEMLDDKDITGVIVTHGTDFLGYTGAALSFMFRDLGKPVVLTYSQRSIDRASSDADLNLQCAAHMAVSDCAEVMIVGHASENDDFCYAMPGTKTRKMHTSRRDAFKVVNDTPIAKISVDGKIDYLREYRARDDSRNVILDSDYSDKVALVKFYPGQGPEILDYYSHRYKGIVVEASGLGHLNPSESDKSWVATLKKLIRSGFVVCAAPQTIYGRLNPMVYSNGRELLDAGVVFLEDMLSETAFVKLGFVLGHRGWKGKFKEKMLQNLAGELNDNLGLKDFK